MRRTSHLSIALLFCPGIVLAQALNLFDVYAQALVADPRVKIAQQKVALGQARADGSFGALLPQANVLANFSDNDVSFDNNLLEDQDYTGKRYSLQVRQVLFNWQALSNRRRTQQEVAQKEAELLDVMSMLLVDTSDRYFNVLLADRNLTLIQSERKLVQQQLRQTEEMYERKLVRITDFLETQARADKVLTDEIEAENEAALARESLSELTGTYVGDLAPLRTDFELPPLENTMDYWVKLATESNALLRSKHEAVAAAKDGIQEQKGGHYPTVDLVYSNQTSDVGFDNQQSPERETEYIGVDINIPLYSGGSTSARVREAWATYYIAREEEEATRREVLKRTREAWLNTRSSRKRIHAAQLSVRSATKSFEAMSKSFNYGTVTAADVLEALHARTRSERDYQNALYQYITNWLALKRESGILEDSDLQQVNSWLLAAGA
jgi:outer membrane protein